MEVSNMDVLSITNDIKLYKYNAALFNITKESSSKVRRGDPAPCNRYKYTSVEPVLDQYRVDIAFTYKSAIAMITFWSEIVLWSWVV